MRATIFFLTFAVFIGAVVWRVDQVMFGDKLAWGEAQARSQMAAMIHALEADIANLRDVLILGYSEIETGKKDYSVNRPYGRFQMVAKVLAPNPKEDRREWRLISTFYREKSPVKAWAAPYISMALKSIKEKDVKRGSANIYSIMDPTRKPYLLALIHGGGNWYVGLVGTEIFQGLMDQQKGQKSTAFVVNLQGQTLGHSIPEYTGSLLTEDPLVGELMKSSVSSGFGTFKDLKGTVIQGLYEQVDRTNFYAVIATPIEQLTANRGEVRWQLILMGLGLGLIGLAYFVFSDRSEARGSVPMAANTNISGLPAAPPSSAAATAAPAPVNNVKMNAYTQVASSLSHELKTPLTAILGHAQLAMAQAEGVAKEHLQKIEKEARTARDIIQKLLIFAGEDKVKSQKAGLETILNRALKHVEGKIISKGIKLKKNIQSVPQFTMASDLLVKAVENILLNSIEAMERVSRKELTVSLQATGPQIILTITDTGEGISSSDLSKIFDPFFTTRAGTQHVGLGLSTAMGIFKEAFGEIRVESEKAKGTTITVEFKPHESMMSSMAPVADNSVPKLKSVQEINSIQQVPKAPGVAPVAQPTSAPPGISISIPVPVNSVTGSHVNSKSALTASPINESQHHEDMPMDPLLVDNMIERMIEDDLPDMPPPPAEAKGKIMPTDKAQAVPQDIQEDRAVLVAPEKPVSNFSSKIDKPKIERKKKVSRLDEIQTAVRRPGERS